MPTCDEIIRTAAGRLIAAGVADPTNDARRLLAFVLGKTSAQLMAIGRDDVPEVDQKRYFKAIGLREERRPMSHIVGQREFYGRSFIVSPDVLDPRPESETLIEAAKEHPFRRILDMGTGSGVLLITLLAELPDANGVGIDISEKAMLIAGENAIRHGVEKRITLPISEWWDDVGGRYDLIISNPPYIAVDEMSGLADEVKYWEPRIALTDEGDGLGAHRLIAPGAKYHLLPGGRLICEIGPTQAGEVSQIFKESGLVDIEVRQDLDGRDRAVIGYRPRELSAT